MSKKSKERMTIETKIKSAHEIYIEIKETCEALFDLHFFNPVPLTRGLLNLKWKVESEKGSFVIKQYNKERYKKYDIEKIALQQDVALREQLRLHEKGILCPSVLSYNGKVTHVSPSGERFVVMDYLQGENVLPGTLNEKQMYSLGQMTARMHNVFNDGSIKVDETPQFMPPHLDERLIYWQELKELNEGNDRVVALIDQQMMATKQFKLQWIASCETGWAHRDLWIDNLLFKDNQLSAILDFDRFAYDYPELDVARAIMSGALKGTQFNVTTARAFLEGYKTNRSFENGVFVRSLYLLWYMESVWWIRADLNLNRYQEVQFQNEMIWLAENLSELHSMFGDL